MNYLQERFEKETGKCINILLQNGQIEIYHHWLKKLNQENQRFLLATHLTYPPDEVIYEITENENYSIIGEEKIPKYLIEAKRQPFYYQYRKITNLSERLSGHLICNGCYEEVGMFINQFLDRGSFTVGVCMEKTDKNYKTAKKCYQDLYQQLLTKTHCALSYQETKQGNYKICILRGGRR